MTQYFPLWAWPDVAAHVTPRLGLDGAPFRQKFPLFKLECFLRDGSKFLPPVWLWKGGAGGDYQDAERR